MKQELEQVVASAVKELFGMDLPVELSRPDEQFGDYATNIALRLAKPTAQNPRDIAAQLKQKLETDERLQTVEIAGPGFLNLRLKETALAMTLKPVITTR